MPIVKWNGPEIIARVTAACEAGVSATTRAAAKRASDHHPWKDESGAEEESVRADPTVVKGPATVEGSFSADSPALFLELGTVKMQAFPFLRPAADATYRELPVRIREAL